MSQNLVQAQKEQTKQVQKLTQQHMLQIRLLEMPLTKLEETIKTEVYDNPALEADDSAYVPDDEYSETNSSEEEQQDYDMAAEKEERDIALENALKDIGGDDVLPDVSSGGAIHDADYEETNYGSRDSFYDFLKEQMNMHMLSDKEKEIMEYLIGSLDNDGLLRTDPDIIIDELAIYNNINVSENEMQHMIQVLQGFDPAGIGARNLRECLMLQIKRKEKNEVSSLMYKVISEHYEDFANNHKEKIWQQLGLGEETARTVAAELKKLNPKPGASLGETEGSKMQQVTPDFIIDTDYNGNISFTINHGMIPELFVSQDFEDMAQEYLINKEKMSSSQKEALLYAKQKVERARGFIEAVKQRRHTLYVTMKAIIDMQKKYFEEGDEAELKPMILKDIADRTGLDISTISRVSNQKYAETPWGTYKLRHFFTNGYVTDGGKELPTRKIKMALQKIIDTENKKHPLSDQALSELMEKKGFSIARRTVAKYRKQLGIPVAQYRKE